MSLPAVPGYEIRGLLAGGGMGAVYLARKHGAAGFVRSVAIKVVAHDGPDREALDALFVREALLHSRVEHPNVVRVEDFGSSPSGHYLVLEYVDGWSLGQILRACARRELPLPVDIATAIVQAALEGLGAIHDMPGDHGPTGAVHGDVSPANILVSRTGQVKVIDLGVAATDDDDPFTGALVRGKAGYASREQAAAQAIDRRADLYSMGVVLWEALTARRLKPRGQSEEAPTRPSQLVPDVSPAMDVVVLRSLADERDDRFATSRDMRRALAGACPSSLFVDAATIADFVLGQLGSELARHVARFEASDVTRASPLRASEPTPVSPSPSASTPRIAEVGPLLGRDAELAHLRRAFEDGARIVAITGPAGVGKTHFVLAAAEALTPAVLVSGGGARSASELEHRVRVALRATGEGNTAVAPLLAERARGERLVLVLDGIEGMAPGAIEAMLAWCDAVPELRAIVTTRGTVPSSVPVTVRLAPLPVPDDVEALRSSAALALWLQAARRHDAGYDVTPGELADVLGIVRATEGLPLALRIAASRTTTLTARAIHDELLRSVLELDADDSAAPLRAAAESALDQLGPAERRAAILLSCVDPLITPRRAGFVLEMLEVPGAKRVIEVLVAHHVLNRVGPHLSMFSFIRTHLRQRHATSADVASVADVARRFLRALAEEALDDPRARAAAEEELPAYLETLGEMVKSAPADGEGTAWLSAVLLWMATEHQGLAPNPSVVAGAQSLLARDAGSAAAHMLLSGGLHDASAQERHAHLAIEHATHTPSLRARLAIEFGSAWMLVHVGRFDTAERTAAWLGTVAADPEHPSLLRLKARLLQTVLLQGMDQPVDVAELVQVLHGMRREGDHHDVSNACRFLVYCDQSDLVERHVREAFDVQMPCRTHHAASIVATYADALLDLGRVAEAEAHYERTIKHRAPRAYTNQCWRSLTGLAMCAAYRGDHASARASAELMLETTTFPVLRRWMSGLYAWLLAATGQKRPAWVERERATTGRERTAGELWWALADHEVAPTAGSARALRQRVAVAASAAGQSFLLRMAIRFAERALAQPLPGESAPRAWTIRDGGAHIEPPDATPISFAGRPLLARLTLVLAEARGGGEAEGYLSVDALVAKCWPDERMSDESAANRLRVCIARLRDAGLRPLIEGSRLGYRFRPDVPVAIAT